MQLRILEKDAIIAGWKTDTLSIDWMCSSSDTASDGDYEYSHCVHAHTVIFFIPGNPGCVQWYTPMLTSVVEQLGEGFAVRGISYAGHGIGNDKVEKQQDWEAEDAASIDAHSLRGQVEHKLQWVISEILRWSITTSSSSAIKIIFLSHSIGSYLVQRICVLRPDILLRVSAVVNLMPFIRFDPSLESQRIPLSFVAHAIDPSSQSKPFPVALLETFSYLSSKLPSHLLDYILLHGAGIVDENGRQFARKLMIQPTMARNFLTLGSEEIRDLPSFFDESALRIIGNQCCIAMLYGGGPDQWAPHGHRTSLKQLQELGVVPKSISTEYHPNLKHHFVVNPPMVPAVVDFCVRQILKSDIKDNGKENEWMYDYITGIQKDELKARL